MPRKRQNQGVQVPTGLPYGEAQQMTEAQQAVPLPQQAPPPRPGRNTPSPGDYKMGPQEAQGRLESALAAAQSANFSPVGIGGPTTRPQEPLTAGLPVGPGPGPPPRHRLSDTLRAIASRSGDVDVADLAASVQRVGW